MDQIARTALINHVGPDAVLSDGPMGLCVQTSAARLHGLLKTLREAKELSFDMLITHTAIDRIEQKQFELVYLLYSTVHGHKLNVTSRIARDNPIAPTASDIWAIAHWQEREAYDLFGIGYDNHPDLRRIFLEDDWPGHPLRKDYQDSYMLEQPPWR